MNHDPASVQDKGHVRIDVFDDTSQAWDYKFGDATLSERQRRRIIENGPEFLTDVTEIKP